MSKLIQLLILSTLYSTLTYAIDLNSTNEIINKATEATKALEVELSSVVNDVEENVSNVSMVAPMEVVEEKIEEIVSDEEPLVEEMAVIESNSTFTPVVETVNAESTEMLSDEVVMFEENSSVVTQFTNVELNTRIVENNTSTIIIVEEKELSVEKGNPKEGKNIFKYVLKEDCNMSAFKFAEKHSQEEWIEILEEDKIKETIFKSCPNVENYYQNRWTDDLYQFFYEASNEDEIPEC